MNSRDQRHYLRDLAAITALPTIWNGNDRLEIAKSLAQVLVKVLYLDFAFVRLPKPGAEGYIESIRCAEDSPWAQVSDLTTRIGHAMSAGAPPDGLILTLPNPLGNGLLRAVQIPIGYGSAFGMLVATSQHVEFPTDEDRLFLNIAANQAAMVLQRHDAEASLRENEQTARFLGDASAALAEMLPRDTTLLRIAGLAVPFFADWCAVDLRLDDGTVQRIALVHLDAAKVQELQELDRRYPPRHEDRHGLMKVLRTGKPDWAAEITDAMLADLAHDEEHFGRLRLLGLKSYICVPLGSQAGTLGALTFITAESGRAYNADHLWAAEDLAHRAAMAVEHANLLAALKESDRRKDEFLAILAHELRNPLAPISHALQIMRAQQPATPDVNWAGEVIDRQLRQLTRLVDDLLDVSRITRGKIELRKERVELAGVVHSAVEANRPHLDRAGHQLTISLPPEPIYLEADHTRLAQVLLNLLNNAAKYTDPGGRIRLHVEREDDDVLIRVQDTGIGIPADMLPQLFDMFMQADRSLDRSQGGLGIGLTLVKRLVHLHGGTVEASSPGPGQGCEFIVRLPTARSSGEMQPQPAQTQEPEDVAQQVLAQPGCRILVVDDSRDAANSLAMLLRMLGNDVRTAHDGLEATEAAADFQPAVVLLDIGLPKLNGYEAARMIREQAGGAGIMLVALTGWGQEEDRRRSREAGFDHHLTKPVDFDLLKKLLASWQSNQA